MTNWYTNQDLAGLVGMPGTARGVQRRAERLEWPSRKRAGSKASEYPFAVLPAETQKELLRIELQHRRATDPEAHSGESSSPERATNIHSLRPVSAIERVYRLETIAANLFAELEALKQLLGGRHA